MPRRTRNTRKKGPSAPGGVNQEKIAAIAGDMERESVDSLLEDFDLQSSFQAHQKLSLLGHFSRSSRCSQETGTEAVREGGQAPAQCTPSENQRPKGLLTPPTFEHTHTHTHTHNTHTPQEILKMELSEFIGEYQCL